ncbi:aminotransferase class V-fold PLP-dependent enzyme, partial [Candidatus Aerophobetes bacterium]|nr:aminotransferase class V-fold PLP-dependent enzyme [Candidatus Aerophobetes bacterium]
FLQRPVDVAREGIDLMSMTAHKVYGPKGAGALFLRKGVKVEKIMDGGFHEFDLRAGTENVPGIAGFGKAIEIFSEQDLKRTKELRNYLYEEIKSNISGVFLNGASDFNKRIPNNLNLSFEYVEGESVILHLDMRGIAVITGSACFSRMLQASHILMAMGFSHERAHGSIRFSPGKYTTKEDIDYTVKQVKEVVENLRELSPLKKK